MYNKQLTQAVVAAVTALCKILFSFWKRLLEYRFWVLKHCLFSLNKCDILSLFLQSAPVRLVAGAASASPAGKNPSERRELDPNMLSWCVYLENPFFCFLTDQEQHLRFVVPLSTSVCFSLKVLPEMSAQPWRGCVCDIEALRQNCATSPSKTFFFFGAVLSLFFLWGDYYISRPHSISVDVPLILPLFHWYVLMSSIPFSHVMVSSPCHCSALMESLVTPLQDRIEEWKKTANQLDKDHAKGQQRWITSYKYMFVSCAEINTYMVLPPQNTSGLVRKLKGSH